MDTRLITGDVVSPAYKFRRTSLYGYTTVSFSSFVATVCADSTASIRIVWTNPSFFVPGIMFISHGCVPHSTIQKLLLICLPRMTGHQLLKRVTFSTELSSLTKGFGEPTFLTQNPGPTILAVNPGGWARVTGSLTLPRDMIS
eukprot:3953153-Amphidinium_carterae.2